MPDTVLGTGEAAVNFKNPVHTELLFLLAKCGYILIKKVNHMLASESINTYNYKIIQGKKILSLYPAFFYLLLPFLDLALSVLSSTTIRFQMLPLN